MSEAGEPNQARTGKGRERQARVLAAALEVYAEGGHGAPIAAVAKRAGLTLPGLLHYYPTKDDLLLALLESHDAESDALMAPESTDWRQALRQLGAINRQNLAKPEVVRLFSILNAESLTRDHPAADWFRRRTDRARGNFGAILRAGIAAGGIRPGTDPDRLALEIIAVWDGLQVLWLRGPAEVDIGAIFEDYLDRLVASLEAPPA